MRLSEAGISGKISIVGGAALSVAYIPERLATTDIDATFPSDPLVIKIINQIAIENDLPLTWINSAVTAFIPFETFLANKNISEKSASFKSKI